MRHTVRLKGVIVGHSELEQTDEEVRRAWGVFRPGLGYDLVQPVFRLFSQAVPQDGSMRDSGLLERYYRARDALRLELEDADGKRIQTSTIHIADYTAERGEGGGDDAAVLELDVLISDDGYWARRHVGPSDTSLH
jgi:hypothetical protein